jgi:hypothetical protein
MLPLPPGGIGRGYADCRRWQRKPRSEATIRAPPVRVPGPGPAAAGGPGREERWVYEFLIAYFSDVRDAADRAAGALEGTAPLSDHDLLVEAYRATQYREGPARRVTYDELVSTGSLGLIADQRLLPTDAIAEAADALRSNPDVLRHLRLRVADLETRLADFTGVNREVFTEVAALVDESP